MDFPRTASIASLAAALLLATSARADETVLSRTDALKLGVERGPAVQEARAPVAVTGAMQSAASAVLPYVPRLNGFGGSRHGDFGTGAEFGASIVQELSLHGLGGARRDVGTAYGHAAKNELERARLEAAATSVLAWIDLVEAQELVGLRRRSREEAEAIAKVARARVDRGVGMPIEGSLAAAEVGAAELAERDAEGRLFEARSNLRFAVALPATAPVRAAGTLDSAPPLDRVAVREHPAAAAARSQIALASADAKLARAQVRPSLGVGVAYSHEGTGEQTVTGTLSVPLPFVDPTRFDAARHEANVLSAQARETRVKAELARDQVLAAHEREHTREVESTLKDRVLVPLRESVRIARAAYEAGTQDATTLLLLRQRLVVAEEQLERATAEVLRADVRYAVAKGTLLDEVSR